jgi:hypothetical protein
MEPSGIGFRICVHHVAPPDGADRSVAEVTENAGRPVRTRHRIIVDEGDYFPRRRFSARRERRHLTGDVYRRDPKLDSHGHSRFLDRGEVRRPCDDDNFVGGTLLSPDTDQAPP